MRYLYSVGMGISIGLQSVGSSRAMDKYKHHHPDSPAISGQKDFYIAGAAGLAMVFAIHYNDSWKQSLAYLIGLATGRIAGNYLFDYLHPDFENASMPRSS